MLYHVTSLMILESARSDNIFIGVSTLPFVHVSASVETPFVHQAAANGAISALVSIIQRDPSLLELQNEEGERC